MIQMSAVQRNQEPVASCRETLALNADARRPQAVTVTLDSLALRDHREAVETAQNALSCESAQSCAERLELALQGAIDLLDAIPRPSLTIRLQHEEVLVLATSLVRQARQFDRNDYSGTRTAFLSHADALLSTATAVTATEEEAKNE